MNKPIIEFKFKYETLTKEIIERKMMVSLDDVWFIDEKFLHIKDDDYDYELVDGEYEVLKNVLMNTVSKNEILEEYERRNKMARINSEIEQEK